MIFVLYFVVGSHFGFHGLAFCSAFGGTLLDGFVFCRSLFSTKSPVSTFTRNEQGDIYSVVSVRFGSVSVSSICYRPGSVHVRFRFLRFLVDFGSVRFGVWNILHWYLFFFRRRKSKYRLLPARGLLLPARGFMSRGFQRAERAELGKPKLPEIASACNLLWRNPYLLFPLNSKNNYHIYNCSNQFIGGGQDGSGSSGSVLQTVPAVHGSYGS